MKSFIYAILRLFNDLSALSKGKAGKRAGRKFTGRMTAKINSKIFK